MQVGGKLSSAHGYPDTRVTTLPLVTKQGGGGILEILWTHLSRGDDLSLPGGWMVGWLDVVGEYHPRTFLSFYSSFNSGYYFGQVGRPTPFILGGDDLCMDASYLEMMVHRAITLTTKENSYSYDRYGDDATNCRKPPDSNGIPCY